MRVTGMRQDGDQGRYEVTLIEAEATDRLHQIKAWAKRLLALLLCLLILLLIVTILPRVVSLATHALERFTPSLEWLIHHRPPTQRPSLAGLMAFDFRVTTALARGAVN